MKNLLIFGLFLVSANTFASVQEYRCNETKNSSSGTSNLVLKIKNTAELTYSYDSEFGKVLCKGTNGHLTRKGDKQAYDVACDNSDDYRITLEKGMLGASSTLRDGKKGGFIRVDNSTDSYNATSYVCFKRN